MHPQSLLLVLANIFVGAQAFWRMECRGRVGLGRIDPLVAPGQPSEHSHTIHGSDGFSMNSDWDDLRAGNCSSCRVQADKSAYWTPTLHFLDHRTNNYELVNQVGGMLAYYLLYGQNISPFKANFSMIAGTPARRTYTAGNMSQPDPAKSLWAALNQTTQEILAQRAIGFNCLNYGQSPEGSLYRHYMPDKAYLDAKCADGIRAELMFPSCWNGDKVVPPNHKDHMAYPDLVMTGNCPDTHPFRLPSLLFETIWDTTQYVNRQGEFVWSMGDNTGLGYHGDFISGWDVELLTAAINKCTNPSGQLEDCPVFAPYLVSEAEASTCHMKLPTVLDSDDVKGPVSTLPGNFKTTLPGNSDTSHLASPHTNSLSHTPGLSTITTSPLSSTSSRSVSTTIAQDVSTTSLAKMAPMASMGPMTPKAPVAVAPMPLVAALPAVASMIASTKQVESVSTATSASVSANAPMVVSTEYVTSGHVVSEILWVDITTYVTETDVVTDTVTVTPSESPVTKRKRSLHAHGHGHKRYHH